MLTDRNHQKSRQFNFSNNFNSVNFEYKREMLLPEISQKDKVYVLLREVYGSLENLSHKQWLQIERSVKLLIKKYGPDIPVDCLKTIKLSHDKIISGDSLIKI